jgi:hypothetical protein
MGTHNGQQLLQEYEWLEQWTDSLWMQQCTRQSFYHRNANGFGYRPDDFTDDINNQPTIIKPESIDIKG